MLVKDWTTGWGDCVVLQETNPYSAGIDFIRQNLTLICRRQILPPKVDPRTVRIKIFLMAVALYHIY